MAHEDQRLGVALVAAGLETTESPERVPGAAHRKLDVFVGKWINSGRMAAGGGVPAAEILTSDVYEWAPGGFFLIHYAYGQIGEHPVGGLEVVSHDPVRDEYVSRFFDSQGNESTSLLTEADGAWTWSGTHTRCTATFSEDGTVQTAHHEASQDGQRWSPSMDVVLRKVV